MANVDLPLSHVCITGSHNTFTGWLQFLLPAGAKYLRNALRRDFRAVELDLYGKNGRAYVQHDSFWQKGYPFEHACAVIRTHGWETSGLPLFLFIDDNMGDDENVLKNAATQVQRYLGHRVIVAKNLEKWTLSKLQDTLVIVSSRTVTRVRAWNWLVSEGMYGHKFRNFGAGEDLGEYKLQETRTKLTRVYPENWLLSTNHDVYRWLGKANFVTFNTGWPWSPDRGAILLAP